MKIKLYLQLLIKQNSSNCKLNVGIGPISLVFTLPGYVICSMEDSGVVILYAWRLSAHCEWVCIHACYLGYKGESGYIKQ